MNATWIPSLLIIPLLLSLVGCSQGSTPANSSGGNNPANIPTSLAKLLLEAGANGTTQQLAVGEMIAISLESNPSTGYSWMATSSNSGVVALMGEPIYTTPMDNGTPVPGAAGTQTFTFQAVKAGKATLTLDYVRPWEKNATPEKTFSVTVEVK